MRFPQLIEEAAVLKVNKTVLSNYILRNIGTHAGL